MVTKKKPVAKSSKPSKKSAKVQGLRSFKRSPETSPFLTFRITYQTAYWLILCLFILGVGIWIVTINMKAQKVYDDAAAIELGTSSLQSDYKKP